LTNVIHLGYVVGTGEPVEIPLRHTAVTGQTQESGKTTTLEGLISRSGLQAVAYVTKRGESSFHVMHPIAPYFQERADWEFVQSLLEAATNTKQDFKQSWIMRASEGAKTLGDVRANIHKFLHGVRDPKPVKHKRGAEAKERWLQKPARGLNADVYYVLDKYLDNIMPQLAEMPYTTELELTDGLNVMDLRDYEFPLQALVIRSVTDFIRERLEDTINIVPEAWKFAPKQRGSPVRLAAEEYVREAAAMKNFLWIDSQDLAGVADVLMRQVGVWLFGVQRAKHEIERALDHMPEGLPARRPRPADIATLQKGQFYVCFGREMYKVYVQPAWMTAAHAEAIARDEESVDTAREILKEYAKLAITRDEAFTAKGVKHGDRQDGVSAAGARKNIQSTETRPLEGEMVSVSQLSRHSAGSQGSSSASGGSAQHRDDPTDAEGEKEEAMWKEKYQTLKTEFDELKQKYALIYDRLLAIEGPSGIEQSPTITGDMGEWFKKFPKESLEATYQYVRKRMREENPEDLLVGISKQEIRVKTERPVITVEANGSLFGRICQLTVEGFFKQPQGAKAATAEAVRRGWCHPKTPVMRITDPLDELAKMGFLTRETDGYQVVSGVKINLEEA
jgi:hypothetical protein